MTTEEIITYLAEHPSAQNRAVLKLILKLQAQVNLFEKELNCLYSVLSEDDMHEMRTCYTQWFAALDCKNQRELLK